jgi:hypothetical protein
VKFVRRVLARNRIRAARRALADDPSPGHYVALAREYAQLGMMREVIGVCEEGLAAFPGSSPITALCERAHRLRREARMVELKRALADAPRPALRREMCTILVASGLLARAENTALDWVHACDDIEAHFTLAGVRLKRFLADRGRDLGTRALEAIDAALALDPQDVRALRLKMQFMTQIGVWKEARRCAAHLLQLVPGDPVLEARFRSLDALSDRSPTVQRALLEVERTGRFAEEGDAERAKGTSGNVRPLLRSLAAEKDVHSALYVRGSTVLVQGSHGATAERMARAVKSILTGSRASSRRLGLGQINKIEVEGDFGALTIAPGEMDAGALWTQGPLSPPLEATLLGLAGMNAELQEAAR